MREWKGAEWREALKNKEFNDEGRRWVISDVKHSQKYKTFMAIHREVGKEDNKENNEEIPIDELLPLCVNEDWMQGLRPLHEPPF